MTDYTARVPDHGWVDWDPDTLREHAYAIQARHRPRRRAWGGGAPTCESCGQVWPCYASRWASQQTAPGSAAVTPSSRSWTMCQDCKNTITCRVRACDAQHEGICPACATILTWSTSLACPPRSVETRAGE